MTNKYVDHLQVLPEDHHNRRMVNGFLLNLGLAYRHIQVFPEAGGWPKVMDALTDPAWINGLTNYPKRHLLLMIDFDEQVTARLAQFQNLRAALPAYVQDRVYLLGCRDEPKVLKAACGLQLETIGKQLANDCLQSPANSLWQHAELIHNDAELKRLGAQVRSFLFIGQDRIGGQ